MKELECDKQVPIYYCYISGDIAYGFGFVNASSQYGTYLTLFDPLRDGHNFITIEPVA